MTVAKGSKLSMDWQPSREQIIYGIGLGLTERQVLECAEDMRLWAEANSNRQIARKAKWGAAFKGWLRREAVKNNNYREVPLSFMDIAEALGNSNGHDRDCQEREQRKDEPDLFATFGQSSRSSDY